MQYKCIYIYVHTCKHQGDQNEILSQSQDLKKVKLYGITQLVLQDFLYPHLGHPSPYKCSLYTFKNIYIHIHIHINIKTLV